MSKPLKPRRGTTAEHANFIGQAHEVTYDTDKHTLVMHDGVTPGGFPLARADEVAAKDAEQDEAIAEELAKYLPLRGGIMDGVIQFPRGEITFNDGASKGFVIKGDAGPWEETSGVLWYASDDPNNPGRILLHAAHNGTVADAIFDPNGAFYLPDCLILGDDTRLMRIFANNVRLIMLDGGASNPGLSMRYSPDTGEIYLDGRAVHGKADAAISADFATAAQNAYGLYGCEYIQWSNSFTIPGYGTWIYMYVTSDGSRVGDVISGKAAGGTVLQASSGWYMDGCIWRCE